MDLIIENKNYITCLKNKNVNHVPSIDLKFDIENVKLKKQDTMYYYIPDLHKRDTSCIACFDLDWTLTYAEKALFPINPDDIKLLNHRKEVLTNLFLQGYLIAVFTNQKSEPKSAKGQEKHNKILERMKTFIRVLNLPIFFFVATGDDKYRKPKTGMFDFFIDYLNTHFKKQKRYIFYVGDAGGRIQDWSDSDKVFAENCSIKFSTPDLFFPNDDKEIRKWLSTIKPKTCIIFIGAPGTGKSSFYRKWLSKYFLVDTEILKTKPKVIKELKRGIYNNKIVVIDGTNPSYEKRKEFYTICSDSGYKVKLVYFVKDGRQWNKIRNRNNPQIKLIPDVVYHVFFKNLSFGNEKDILIIN